MNGKTAKIYVCHVNHEHDRLYAENVTEYLNGRAIATKTISLARNGARTGLQECLDDPGAAVLGFNATLDHSWLEAGSFIEAAERRGLPVIQWIVDHPSARWPEFSVSSAANSRFLLNSEQQRRYFETYCLPGALAAATGGVGPNWRSRIDKLSLEDFSQRPWNCLVPLSLHRIRSIEQSEAALAALDPTLAAAVREAVDRARHDLTGSLHPHVTRAVAVSHGAVAPETLNLLCQLVEESVQTWRRLKIFAVAKDFPVLTQSDQSAASFVRGSAASFSSDTGMRATLERMPMCRAVLSVTPMNDMIHDRTMNAVNAGCVAIVEDNAANREIFSHGENALLFRYDDDSLVECLDIVCNRPQRACEIARAGMRLRDEPRLRFGRFQSIVELASRMPSTAQTRGNRRL